MSFTQSKLWRYKFAIAAAGLFMLFSTGLLGLGIYDGRRLKAESEPQPLQP